LNGYRVESQQAREIIEDFKFKKAFESHTWKGVFFAKIVIFYLDKQYNFVYYNVWLANAN
jgi:hypothetical protein